MQTASSMTEKNRFSWLGAQSRASCLLRKSNFREAQVHRFKLWNEMLHAIIFINAIIKRSRYRLKKKVTELCCAERFTSESECNSVTSASFMIRWHWVWTFDLWTLPQFLNVITANLCHFFWKKLFCHFLISHHINNCVQACLNLLAHRAVTLAYPQRPFSL